MSISRDPDELAKAQSSDAETTSEDEADTETEEITAYMRIGDSKIIYRLSGEDYETLMAAGYNDLRHTRSCPLILPTSPRSISPWKARITPLPPRETQRSGHTSTKTKSWISRISSLPCKP